MAQQQIDQAPASWVEERAISRLHKRLEEAIRRARGDGKPTIASVTAKTVAPADPTAVVVASRRQGEPWFCLEQSNRGGSAVAALGCTLELEGRGEERFEDLGRRWRELAARAAADPPARTPGSGLSAVGGFAFAPNGGGSPRWQGFSPASLIVPEVLLSRLDGLTWMTLNVLVGPDDAVGQCVARVQRRLSELRAPLLPLLDPSPAGTFTVSSPIPPSHYEEAVASAVKRIRGGELEKVVLAREVEVRAPAPHNSGAVLGVLREGFPSCYVYAVGRGDAAFLGASPELLVRREGQRASTVALAGSTRRSADPSVDAHLAEQLLRNPKEREENAVVARRIARALSPFSVWVTAAAEPVVVQVANIQHLAAPIRAQLARPVGAIELAGALHPTPAVGGEPSEVSQRLIPALEGLDRGWYAGPVGWCDAAGDGEFCVALRCALLRGVDASLYAGCGIMGDSDPASELAESELKLQALMPLLAG